MLIIQFIFLKKTLVLEEVPSFYERCCRFPGVKRSFQRLFPQPAASPLRMQSMLGTGHSHWPFFFFFHSVWLFALEASAVSSSSWLGSYVIARFGRPRRISTGNNAAFQLRLTHLHRFKQKSQLFILLVFSPSVSALNHPPLSFQVAHCVGC